MALGLRPRAPATKVVVAGPFPRPEALRAAGGAPNLTFAPSLDGAFGGVIATDVFEHVEDPVGLMCDIADHVAVGGWMLTANHFAPSIKCHALRRRAPSTLDPATTRYVAPSRWMAAEAARSGLLDRFDVSVIPNAIDCRVFAPRDRVAARARLGLGPDRPVVLFAAESLSNHRKGFDLAIQAFATLPDHLGAVLAMIGRSPEGAAPPHCLSLGRIDGDHALAEVFAAADLFVLPSRADNLPNVLLEALACGVPCVAFDVGGVADVVRPGVTGALVPAGDAAALGAAVAGLLGSPETRAAMAARCREAALSDYDAPRVAARMAALYQTLMEAGARRP